MAGARELAVFVDDRFAGELADFVDDRFAGELAVFVVLVDDRFAGELAAFVAFAADRLAGGLTALPEDRFLAVPVEATLWSVDERWPVLPAALAPVLFAG